MTMLWTRLFLYVLAGWLVGRGMPADMADVFKDPAIVADINTALGGAIFAITKYWHTLAQKHGWTT